MDLSTFRKRFKELSPTEQEFLKVLTIVYEPINQTNMMNLLRSCEIKNERGVNISSADVRRFKEMLDAGGWLQLGEGNELQVAPDKCELVMRMAVVDPRFKNFVTEIERTLSYRNLYFIGSESFTTILRSLRIRLYEGDILRTNELLNLLYIYFPLKWRESRFFEVFFLPLDKEWFATFPIQIQTLALGTIIRGKTDAAEPTGELLQIAEKWLKDKKTASQAANMLILPYLWQGRFEEAEKLLNYLSPPRNRVLWKAILQYTKGQADEALKSYAEFFKASKLETGEKTKLITNFPGSIQLLTLLRAKPKNYLNTIDKLVGDVPSYNNLDFIRAAARIQLNYADEEEVLLSAHPYNLHEWIIWAAACWWSNLPIPSESVETLKSFFHKTDKNGYRWLTLQLAAAIGYHERDKKKAEEYKVLAARLEEELGAESIMDLIQPIEKWKRSLDALEQLQAGHNAKAAKGQKTFRLVWWMDFENENFQPIEQSLGNTGWSKGRKVALRRLREFQVNSMTDQDKAAAQTISAEKYGYYGSVEYDFNTDKLLLALVGHPLLFLMDNPNISIELIEKKPQLMVEETRRGYEMHFSHDFTEAGVQLIRETPTRFILLNISPAHAEINRLMEFGRLELPAKAKDQIARAVGNLSTIVTVQSELGAEGARLPTIDGNPVVFVHLLPIGDGFKIEFFVKPFTEEPPYFKPGVGRENIIAEVNGQSARAKRDLKKEKENARRVEDACPTLQRISSENLEWLFDDLEDCLNVLLELEPLRQQGDIVMEYPKGEKLRIAGQVGFDQLSMGISKERNWFSMTGEVKVDEELVMDFHTLLNLAQHSKSRFVEIKDGQFIALTSQLRRKLEELDNIFSKTKNELRFNPLAIHSIEDFTDLLQDVKVDAAWKKQVSRLKESQKVKPDVPSTFKAELRPYQEEGFRWLSQMAHWGVGACLADDMGLGKTIQALALLLHRAKQGPAMVVAPASVVRNWYHEVRKFAPTLNPLVFGEADRQKTVDELEPCDLLLVSYGLLQQESEMLTKKHFNAIVLDEAQAIKNRATKRSQAAMQLQADFKVITTGTPIENHLGELWNLFNFLNPGLLGSLEHFNETYAAPIERLQDRERRQQLRKVLQPFILRRRKNDVLDELPEKTEITLTVELSPEERAFYEALRREAVMRIESSSGDAADKRFKILAELMRLRQAACNPRMIQPDSALPSSKLNLLIDTVDDLRDGNHKALIFSQFVKHLKIVEEWVRKEGIPYQYLDGSTPMAQRDKAIQAFQSGDGDLFLISLKAGGFGLNLTAADYVLHLDPWWNPAVEDQASDRAHRIGQQRPVTIYRLVAENTIEEKIVKLHADKRELADSLLEGAEVSGKLSADELLELIRS